LLRKKNMSAAILLGFFLAATFLPLCCCAPVLASDATESPDGGALQRLAEFARKYLLFQGGEDSKEDESSGDKEGVFSKNPFVYIAAFWTEIVNAPSEQGFFERILAFLEAVRKTR